MLDTKLGIISVASSEAAIINGNKLIDALGWDGYVELGTEPVAFGDAIRSLAVKAENKSPGAGSSLLNAYQCDAQD